MTEEPLHSPEPSLGGPDVDAAVQNAEEGSRAAGVHRPAGPGRTSADSRLEGMREVDTTGTGEAGDG